MNQYILLIHGNAATVPTSEQWVQFFDAAEQIGCFRGGSEIGKKQIIGSETSACPSEHIVGFMRFNAREKQTVIDLLESHPVVLNGGSVELCEMPES